MFRYFCENKITLVVAIVRFRLLANGKLDLYSKQKTMKKFLLLLLAMFGMFFTACERGDGVEEIELSKQSIEVGFESNTYTVSVTSPCSWKAESNNEWIVVESKTGIAGTKELSFKVERNETKKEREGTIVVKNSDYNLISELYVIQNDEESEKFRILYTSLDGNVVTPCRTDCFGANIVSNTYENGIGIIKFDAPVTTIGNYAFSGCRDLKSVTIPNSVTSIGESAFSGCYDLNEVHINDLAAWCNIDFGSYTANPLYYANNLYLNDDLLTELVIPDQVTEIKNYAFFGCSGLTSIVIPNSVTSIGESAFEDCYSLTSIVIPNSVTSIGEWAFSGCYDLKTVYNFSNLIFSKGSTDYGYIAYYADYVINAPKGFTDGDFAWFENEDGMTLAAYLGNAAELTVPIEHNGKSVTSIGNYAFSDCSGLTSIEIPNSVTEIGDYAFKYCSGLTSVEIPNSVTSIGDYAFYRCTGLTSVVIGNSVTSIGIYAFFGCSGLTSVEFNAENCTYMGNSSYPVFGNCTALSIVTIGENVKTIPSSAFSGCSGLTSIEIPNSVTSIGYEAFRGCSGIKTVINFSNLTFSKGSSNNGYVAYYADKVINAPNSLIEGDYIWCKLNGVNTLACYFGDATELVLPVDYNGENYAIGNYAFSGCTGLTSIVIPNSVTSIGESAFSGSSSLTNIIIGNSVTTIGDYAFYSCSCLTNIIIPNSVTSIGESAFQGCSSLTSVYCKPTTPPTGNYYLFYDAPSRLLIYVPTASVEAYKSAYFWSDYKSKIVGYDL